MLTLGGSNLCPLLDYSGYATTYTDYQGTTTCLACAPYTCRNGGVCSGAASSLFSCSCGSNFADPNCGSCAAGQIGDNCETSVDTCSTSPCQNNGVCFNGLNSYACICPAGFNGTNCQTSTAINYCSSNPCLNKGTCFNGVSGFACVCPTGFNGTTCQNNVLTTCSSNPCLNGGACFNGVNSFACICKNGFNGTTCQNNIAQCTSLSPCKNAATCTNGVNTYTCTCAAGWTGVNCTALANPCLPNPCLNLGTCIPTGVPAGYNCSCINALFNGTTCQSVFNKTPVTSFSVVASFYLNNLNFTTYNSSSSNSNLFKSVFKIFVNQTFSVPLENVYINSVAKGGIRTNFTIDAVNLAPATALAAQINEFQTSANKTSFTHFVTLLGTKLLLNVTTPVTLNATATPKATVANPTQLYPNQAVGVAIAAVILAALVFGTVAYLNNRFCAKKH